MGANLRPPSAPFTPVRVEQDLAAAIDRLPAAFHSYQLREAFENLVDLEDSDIDEDTLSNIYACARLRAKFLASSVETRCAIGRILLPFVKARFQSRFFGTMSGDNGDMVDLNEMAMLVGFLRDSIYTTNLRTTHALERERNLVLPILLFNIDTFRIFFGPSFASIGMLSFLGNLLNVPPVPTLPLEIDEQLSPLHQEVYSWIKTLHELREEDFARKNEVLLAANLMAEAERKVGIDGVEGLSDAVVECVLRWKEVKMEKGKGA